MNIPERHEYWWNYLLDHVYVPENFERELPLFEYVTRISRVAGTASSRSVRYNLNYVLQEGAKYDETVCHEICHVFANRLVPGTKHGSLWYYLFNVVCKVERGQHHSYSRPTPETKNNSKVLKKLIKLQEELSKCTKL